MAKVEPIIKWPGGKRKLAPEIVSHFGKFNKYYEPFAGGAAVMLELCPTNAIISDINAELINLYNVIKEYPEELCLRIEKEYIPYQSKEFYYHVRNKDREPSYLNNESKENRIDRAARFLFLNKTGFNGLTRVNSNGQCNVAFGKRTYSFDKDEILNLSSLLNRNHIEFRCQDYRRTLMDAGNKDLVYMDPPYDVEEGQNGFTAYTKSSFNREDQIKLKSVADQLLSKGCNVFISNADTEFVRGLYGNDPRYVIHEMKAQRCIGCTSESRKKITELLIEGKTSLRQKAKYIPQTYSKEIQQRALL